MNPHEKTIQDIWLDFQKIRHAGCSHRSTKVNFTKLLVCWKHLWKISDWMGEQFWVGLICEGIANGVFVAYTPKYTDTCIFWRLAEIIYQYLSENIQSRSNIFPRPLYSILLALHLLIQIVRLSWKRSDVKRQWLHDGLKDKPKTKSAGVSFMKS